jgi:hypothetical protein
VPVNENLSCSETGSCSSDGGEFGSLFSWTEESSDEDLDYFDALDVAAAESVSHLEVREVSDPPIGACCACPVAPLGDFCTDLSFSKDFVWRTRCACPAAPLGCFCMDLSHERVC